MSKDSLAKKIRFGIIWSRVFYLFFLSDQLIIRVWLLWFVVYLQHVIYHDFAFFAVCLFIYLWNTDAIF